MKKNKICLLFLIAVASFSCKNKNENSIENISVEPSAEENEFPIQMEKPVEEKWRTVFFINELEGNWISKNGNLYQYPFFMDEKCYLRWAMAAVDDTALWQNYADENSLSLQQLWNKRFACVNKIYNRDFPFVDESGYQEGLKFFLSDGKIMRRLERLIPVELVEWNLESFQISDMGNLRQKEKFYLSPADENWQESYCLEPDGLIYYGAENHE